MASTVAQNRIMPDADEVTDLVTVARGRMIPMPMIQVQNTDPDADWNFQCFLAMDGAAHAAQQALGPVQGVAAGSSIVYPSPLSADGLDVIRVWTDCTNNKVVFTMSQPTVRPR